jgi:hypothetical protein
MRPALRDGRASLCRAEDEDGRDALLDEESAKVATETARRVLAYNLARVMNMIGIQPLIVVLRA